MSVDWDLPPDNGGYACGDEGLRLVSGRLCCAGLISDRLLNLHIYTP
jgi:hypothetical protein